MTPAGSERPWCPIDTELGTVSLSPLDMETLNVSGDSLTINRVEYRLYGPLYWLRDHWSAYESGKARTSDPDFSLIRLDDPSREGTHPAYRKAVAVIEDAVNEWMPSQVEFARLAVASLESLLAEAVVELAEWYRDPEHHERFRILVETREEYVAMLGKDLEVAKRLALQGLQ
jgi:hypothetical protein